jgi:hypothetical protein
MSAAPSILEEVRDLLVASNQGKISESQFQTQRAVLLLAAEADLIERRDTLDRGLAGGTISGLMAADTRASLLRTEDELREAATMAGLTRAQPSAKAGSGLNPVDTLPPHASNVSPSAPASRLPLRYFIPLDGPEAGILARRVGSVLPTAAGAVVFAPVGVLVVMGKLEGWLPILGVVMIMMAVACVLTARERWENPDPT